MVKLESQLSAREITIAFKSALKMRASSILLIDFDKYKILLTISIVSVIGNQVTHCNDRAVHLILSIL